MIVYSITHGRTDFKQNVRLCFCAKATNSFLFSQHLLTKTIIFAILWVRKTKEVFPIGKFIVKKTSTGFKFDLKAGNGEVIATSEGYKSKSGCQNGIESVGKNAPDAEIENA